MNRYNLTPRVSNIAATNTVVVTTAYSHAGRMNT